MAAQVCEIAPVDGVGVVFLERQQWGYPKRRFYLTCYRKGMESIQGNEGTNLPSSRRDSSWQQHQGSRPDAHEHWKQRISFIYFARLNDTSRAFIMHLLEAATAVQNSLSFDS